MRPRELLRRLAQMFPEFQTHWDGPGNLYRNHDGSFTLHGVFSEFTTFFQESHAELPSECVAELGAFVSECMAAGEDSPLDNAVATCFVENIAGDPCDRELAHHLTGEARKYWLAWGGSTAQ